MILLDALVHAPLCAVSKRWPRKLHAVDRHEIADAWPSGTVTAVCGTQHLRLLAHADQPVLWPPSRRAASMPRCEDCWVTTGRRPPRTGRQITGRRHR